MSELIVGPAGWSYPDWKGRVYPQPLPRGFDPLAFLSGIFRGIEVDSTFYRPPEAARTESWAKRTPPGFLFAVKAWERFTHDRAGFSDDDALGFREGLEPLRAAGKLGALLLQFPWFFRDGPEARDRIRRAADALRGCAPLVVELRHVSWLRAFDFLKEQGLSFCNIDQPASSTALTGTRHVTGPVGYVRLHGRNAKAWFDPKAGRDQKYDYLYSREELQDWVEAVRSMGEADRLFVITNNHFQGKAVANAIQLARALGQDVEAPEPLRSVFPDLAKNP
jgi:uncharacterized protein YecE (DUF72 family)